MSGGGQAEGQGGGQKERAGAGPNKCSQQMGNIHGKIRVLE